MFGKAVRHFHRVLERAHCAGTRIDPILEHAFSRGRHVVLHGALNNMVLAY